MDAYSQTSHNSGRDHLQADKVTLLNVTLFTKFLLSFTDWAGAWVPSRSQDFGSRGITVTLTWKCLFYFFVLCNALLFFFITVWICFAAINRLQSKRRLQRRNQSWRWSHLTGTGMCGRADSWLNWTWRLVLWQTQNLYVLLFICFLFHLISSSITQSMDSGGTDNFILISQLKEEVMSLKRLLQQRDQTILEKDRKVGCQPRPSPQLWLLKRAQMYVALLHVSIW